MIVSYRDKRTRDLAAGKRVKAFSGIERAARLKLDRLEATVVLKDPDHFQTVASRSVGASIRAAVSIARSMTGI